MSTVTSPVINSVVITHTLSAITGTITVLNSEVATINTVNAKGAHGSIFADTMQTPTVIIGNQSFPIIVEVAPGVMLMGASPVFDSSVEGQAASLANEHAFSPSLAGSPTSGDSPPGGTGEANPTYVECSAFSEVITVADMQKAVSKWFKLGNCRDMPVAQRGLTARQIACNWAALCTNILDPVYEQFKFTFNSGFRNASRDSGGDHGVGCAADISMPTTEQTIAMYKWMIHSGLPFSQVIYEKHNSAWVHVAFNGKGPKGAARTMWTYTGSAPYGYGGQNGESLPPELA
jgi:hypothetical protein